jgi:ribosomal protein S27AE
LVIVHIQSSAPDYFVNCKQIRKFSESQNRQHEKLSLRWKSTCARCTDGELLIEHGNKKLLNKVGKKWYLLTLNAGSKN